MTDYGLVTLRRNQSFDCSNPPVRVLRPITLKAPDPTFYTSKSVNAREGIKTMYELLTKGKSEGSKSVNAREGIKTHLP